VGSGQAEIVAEVTYVPEPAIVIFDFEDGVNRYVAGAKTAGNGINLTTTIPKARGNNYMTAKTADGDGWTSKLGQLVSNVGEMDLAKFHDPHLTFLINTNGSSGYFQVLFTQSGTNTWGHFTPANSSDETDDYNFQPTNGWEWRSVRLKDFDWGNSLAFDPKGKMSGFALEFYQGNGSGFFEVNIDQVMITDGKSLPLNPLFSFENGVNPLSGGSNGSIVTTGTIEGDKFLKVANASVVNWATEGTITATGPINLASMKHPYLNLWVNTGSAKGYFQLITHQGGFEYGGHPAESGVTVAADYQIQTNNQWVLVNIPLKEFAWKKGWATLESPDYSAPLDDLTIEFKTGNVAGAFDIRVDDITISDGPAF
jgi:hypothetical protein